MDAPRPRLKSSLPLRYRGKNLATWYEGMIQNISQSACSFTAHSNFPPMRWSS